MTISQQFVACHPLGASTPILPLHSIAQLLKARSGRYFLGLWLLSLAASIGLGLASVIYHWSGLSLPFGGLNLYVTAYPPLTICLIWSLWFGYGWGALPAYLATLVLSLYAGMPLAWALLFSIADPLALAVFTIVYRAMPTPQDWRSGFACLIFCLLAFIASVLASSASFIWTYTNQISGREVFIIWQAWWLGGFLQIVFTVLPVLCIFSRQVITWRNGKLPFKSNTLNTRRNLLQAASLVAGGVLLYIWCSFQLGKHILDNNIALIQDPLTKTAINSLQEQTLAVYWVLIILVISISFGGFRLFTYWIDTIQRSANEAAQANRSKTEFLARMSHEIRTPMNAIVGMTQLCSRTELSLRQQEYLQIIHNASDSLLLLIDDILDFSSIESGQLRLERKPFELVAILNELQQRYSPRAQSKGIVFELLPLIKTPCWLYGDPLRLNQILVNLISNAIKFTELGGVRLSVEIAQQTETYMHLRFAVSDTGIGMDQAKLAGLFNAFAQADESITRRFGGTGLGLAISKKLVEIMHGTIWAESAPSCGSRFNFCLSFEIAPQPAIKHSKKSSHTSNLTGCHVLLVEDNPINRLIAEEFLHDAGINVDWAKNGAEGISKIEANPYDAVLMDIQMPILDGLSATRQIRKQAQFSNLPIIAMTAHSLNGDKERCLAAGMNDFISKPIDPDLLQRVLAKAMGRNMTEPKSNSTSPQIPTTGFVIRDGIDLNIGLQRLNNRRERYLSILANFRQHHAQTTTTILENYQQGKIEEVHRLAHSIKSIASYMGALKLEQNSIALEAATLDGQGSDVAELHLTEFCTSLSDLMSVLDEEALT